MRIRDYESSFADDIVAYLAFKKNMGVESNSREWHLWKFDSYCAERDLTEFNKETVEGWVLFRREGCSQNHLSWMSFIRDFGRYLRISGKRPDAYVLSDEFKSRFYRPTPYLLSQDEIEAFFTAASKLKMASPWEWEARCFFGLMHSLGLRTCETRRLNTTDVNINERFIDIIWSKGSRSRRLYITDEVAAMLAACDARNQEAFGSGPRPFFISATGNRVCNCTTGVVFKRIWEAAGLSVSQGGRKPRPYSFRHHFAYASIERWASEGTDIEAMLPYLARYMGHATFDSTYYYVHTSPDFMSGYANNIKALESLLPEVDFDG
jgi:integrase